MSTDEKRFHSIADDHQRAALLRSAISKGQEQARGDFIYALLTDGLDDESLTLFAREAYDTRFHQIEFDYPQFAQSLFLGAYRLAYRARLRDLANGQHHSADELVALVEAEAGLIST
jgi:hypothetical protein